MVEACPFGVRLMLSGFTLYLVTPLYPNANTETLVVSLVVAPSCQWLVVRAYTRKEKEFESING